MKGWHSVSTRLIIMLVGLTLGSLVGLSLVLDAALKNFFVRDALATLRQQSDAFAAQACFGVGFSKSPSGNGRS